MRAHTHRNAAPYLGHVYARMYYVSFTGTAAGLIVSVFVFLLCFLVLLFYCFTFASILYLYVVGQKKHRANGGRQGTTGSWKGGLVPRLE